MTRTHLPDLLAHLGPGWIDTPVERAFWATRRFLGRPQALKASFLACLLLAPSVASAQTPVTDSLNLHNNIYQFGAQGIRERISQLWKETKDEARWVTDLIEGYRAIKMARATYESLATFDLAQNLNVVDLLPQLDLEKGQYFGDDGSFSDDGNKKTYLSLRFKLNPAGGIRATLDPSTLPKFRPKFRFDASKVLDQLLNLDFDAVQMVQYRGPDGELKGAGIPIDPRASVAQRRAFWDRVLKEANDFAGQRLREQETYRALQQQITWENRSFQEAAMDLKARADLQDEELRRRLQGVANIPSTYDLEISPRVALAKQILALEQARNRRELQAGWDRITALKRTEEKRQAAVNGDSEVVGILAEAAKIQQDTQRSFQQILEKYKVKRKDPGEKVGGGVLPSITLSSSDLEDMKLPPPAQEEVTRMLHGSSQAMAVLQMKLQAQKVMADNLGTIDGVTKELSDATDALANAYRSSSDHALADLAKTLRSMDQSRLHLWEMREEANRQESAARTAAIFESFSAANKKYFDFLLTKKSASAAGLLENLLKTYGQMLRTYVGGRTVADVMGSRFQSSTAEYQAEQNLYGSM